MEYHKLSYVKDVGEIDGDVYLNIVIDGTNADYQFDVAALKVSSMIDGIYPIVVCTCGYIACSGMYVSTRIEGDNIIWEKFFFGQCGGTPEAEDVLNGFTFTVGKEKVHTKYQAPLYFKKDVYTNLANELIEVIMSKNSDNKKWIEEDIKNYSDGNTWRM